MSNQVTLNYRNSEVVVDCHGATVVSWKVEGKEKLFVSKKAVFDQKKAIRGGIPVVFPNFGAWECGPQHGFARTSAWKCSQSPEQKADSCTAVFTLTDSEHTRQLWNFPFRVDYTIRLTGNSLDATLDIHNTGTREFDFTCLLHTYFLVHDVTKTTVRGLKGCTYTDKVKGSSAVEDRDDVVVLQNEDRVYANTKDELDVQQGNQFSMKIVKRGFPDAVVWNPWAEKAAAMSDFGDDEYKIMLCVEPGRVSERQKLPAGQKYSATMTLLCKL